MFRLCACSFVVLEVAACGDVKLGDPQFGDPQQVTLCDGPIEILDPGLRDAVRAALGLAESVGATTDGSSESGDGADKTAVPGDALKRLRGLRASDLNITTLNGLECALALETLGLANNRVDDLTPLRGLMRLTELQVSGNPLGSFEDVATFGTLERLSANDVDVDDVTPLQLLTQLRSLELAGNALGDVAALGGLTQLEVLVLSRNALKNVEALAGMVKLGALELAENNIVSLDPLAALADLRSLDIRQNKVASLRALANLSALVEVQAAGNVLLTLEGLVDKPSLWRVNVRDNQLATTAGLANLPALTELDVRENALVDIEGLSQLPQLRRVWLANNHVVSLEPLRGRTQLAELNVRANPELEDVAALSTLERLVTFTLGGHQAPLDLSDLAGLPMLRTLDVANTDVMDWSFVSTLPRLTKLVVKQMSFQDSDMVAIGGARTLEMVDVTASTGVALEAWMELAHVRRLVLSKSDADDLIAAEHWTELEELVAVETPLTSLRGLEGLAALAQVDVRQTAVDSLVPLAFNAAFSRGDRLDVRKTALGVADCVQLGVLRRRGVAVRHDLTCAGS